MAVQAQYPANLLILDSSAMVVRRAEAERSSKDTDLTSPFVVDQSPSLFSSYGGNANARKRGRAAASAAIRVPLVFTQSAGSPEMIDSSQFRSPVHEPPLSTGLGLWLDEENQLKRSDSIISAVVSEELAAQVNQQNDEIQQFLLAQREQLRQELIDRRHRHNRSLLAAAGKTLAKKLHEKELEINLAARQSADLENRLIKLRSESMAWQSKAMSEQETAASLHAQLQRVAAARAEYCDEKPTEDAQSAFIDPERLNGPLPPCRACRRRPATVLLIPCKHLSLCPACDSSAAVSCLICGALRSGSVQVLLS